jgi:YjbE family integral membrane protein
MFSPAWWSALGSIILIDLVLAGDNALVIGIAASRLPEHLRKRAIIAGAAGAIVVRALLTLVVVWLLRIPGLLLVGGLLLFPVAYKLAVPKVEEAEGGHTVQAASTFWEAMRTIIVADALMGVDNMLGVGGAAHGHMELVVFGLLLTIPLVVWGSTFVTKLMERWNWLAAVGAAVLGYTGAGMVVSDRYFDSYVWTSSTLDMVFKVASAVILFAVGYWAARRVRKAEIEREAGHAATKAAEIAGAGEP